MTARALAAAVVIVVVAAIARAEPAAPRATPIGFDHVLHERDVLVSGGESIACARCHAVQRGAIAGKPGHAACFGACHGAAPTAPARGAKIILDEARAKICTNCHAEAQLAQPYRGALAVPYPPYTFELDFSLSFGHAQHHAAPCQSCHDVASDQRPAPHARCLGCHDGGKSFAMTECARCHQAAVGKPQPPELAPIANSVTAIFSHARHAARATKDDRAGRECATCHAAIAATDASELPRPTTAECARCHDGAQAFAVTEQCTRCHAAPAGAFDVARPETRFRHGSGVHGLFVPGMPCGSCHGLAAASGDATVPSHAACARCHASDFAERKPMICGACHIGTEPWRHLRGDRPPPDATELGATLDHGKHPGACTTCHARRTPLAELQLPHGHAACTGAACHAQSAGPAPHLSDCTACHALGRAADRDAARAADPWSVRVAFTHATHASDRGAPLPCTECHVDLSGADVVTLAAPPKRTCARCHDGAIAFSLTGTTCRKCHTK